VPRSIKRGALGLALKCFSVSNEYMSFSLKARRFLKGLDYADNVRHQVWIGSFHPREQEGLLAEAYRPRTPSEVYATTAAYYDRARSLSPLNRALYLYVKTYMTDDILAKVDRASMANSLEVRAPFLDNELTGFAATIPPSMKLRNFRTKWIFRSALKGRLPDRILNKKKQGFAVPVAQWLKEDLRPLLLDAFEKRKIEAQGIFDYKAVEALVRQFLADKADTRKEIWALFMFQMWYDKWMRRS
jgi:asparagine synthase (glutamine-hydrolysing)